MKTPETVSQVTITIEVNEGRGHVSSKITTEDIDVAVVALTKIKEKRIAEADRINKLENNGDQE